MKRSHFIGFMVGMLLLIAVQAQATDIFLKGVETAKGVDIGAIRYGTSFVGQVQAIDKLGAVSETIGYWNIVLNYKGSANVGVCGGENDIVYFTLKVYFTTGKLAGNKLVLGMRNKNGVPMFWNYFDTPCETIGGFDCNCPSGSQSPCTGPVSNLAEIDNLSLSAKVGTTLKKVTGATLSGWLCHTYPYVPRVSGTLSLKFK